MRSNAYILCVGNKGISLRVFGVSIVYLDIHHINRTMFYNSHWLVLL